MASLTILPLMCSHPQMWKKTRAQRRVSQWEEAKVVPTLTANHTSSAKLTTELLIKEDLGCPSCTDQNPCLNETLGNAYAPCSLKALDQTMCTTPRQCTCNLKVPRRKLV